MKCILRNLAVLGAIGAAATAAASAQTQQPSSSNGAGSQQIAVRESGFTPVMMAAINAHAAKASRIAQQIRESSGGMNDASYTNLSLALLGASEAGLNAAAAAQSYKTAMTAIRSADEAGVQRIKPRPVRTGGIQTADFGSSTDSEFVFYAIVPCRLLDTREDGGTRLAPLVPYLVDFDGGNFGNTAGCTYSGVVAQLGNSLSGLSRAALVINLTTTGASESGWIQARPVGSSSFTSNQNFYPGQNIANMVVVQNSGTADADFELVAQVATHAVVDVLGVFAPPLASALDCTYATIAGSGSADVPNNTEFHFATPAACPATYALTSISCLYAGVSPPGLALTQVGSLAEDGLYACVWRNQTGLSLSSSSFSTHSRCCRVPGR